jgi:hypothetical protein
MTTNTYADRYASGLKAFAVLTGELDRNGLKDAIRDGFAALLEWSEKTSGRDIARTSGRSANAVARDIRAARFMAEHPKADPVSVVKACNVLTAAQVAKADSPKALADAFRKASGEVAKGRKARGKELDQADKGDKADKGSKQGPSNVKALTPENLMSWISLHCTWSVEDATAVAQAFTLYAQDRAKADKAVA